MLAYISRPQFITLKPEVFKKYLEQEGLNKIITLRDQLKLSDKEGREKYTRYTKVLLQVGEIYDKSLQKVLGQKLEIIPEQNPYGLKVGDELTVKVIFEGKPLRSALVSATHTRFEGKEGYACRVRTDAKGRAKFRLTATGPWLVRLVHMIPLKGSAQVDWESFARERIIKGYSRADWESFWASMTFALKSAPKQAYSSSHQLEKGRMR